MTDARRASSGSEKNAAKNSRMSCGETFGDWMCFVDYLPLDDAPDRAIPAVKKIRIFCLRIKFLWIYFLSFGMYFFIFGSCLMKNSRGEIVLWRCELN